MYKQRMQRRISNNLDSAEIVQINSPILLPSVDNTLYGTYNGYQRWWQCRTQPIPDKVTSLENLFITKAKLERLSTLKKLIFDSYSLHAVRQCRTKCNPLESIGNSIFLNRAALKLAEIDAVFDFMFSRTKPVPDTNYTNEPNDSMMHFFADICGGPGGFSEYMLWRRRMGIKGFGITLRNGIDDFNREKLSDKRIGVNRFGSHYGADGTGNIYMSENIDAFAQWIMYRTAGLGVHAAFADGGFSVEQQEDFQEVASKKLYVAQFLCALRVLRKGGNFMCKLFDHNTEFTIGLSFMITSVFANVYIYKPATSRPANAERYVICHEFQKSEGLDLQSELEFIDRHGTADFDSLQSLSRRDKRLVRVVDQLTATLKQLQHVDCSRNDVLSIIPPVFLRRAAHFVSKVETIISQISFDQLVALEQLYDMLKGKNTISLQMITEHSIEFTTSKNGDYLRNDGRRRMVAIGHSTIKIDEFSIQS